MKTHLFVCVTVLSLFGAAAVKADQAPESNKDRVSSVAWVQERDRANDLDGDDRYVVLIGKVTKKYKDETYFFNDGTGTIQLDSEERLPVGTTIAVRGYVDQAFLGIGKLEVDVKSWRHVK